MTLMKPLFVTLGVALAAMSAFAQPTWEVGNTTLEEYDLVTGVQVPWELLWGPDDMLWCTTRNGDVLRIDPISGSYETVLSLNVFFNGSSEPGLLGMAMHPDWANTQEVFLVYCAGSNWNNAEERLSAFTWNGSSLVNETVLYTVEAGGIHNGSRLLVLPDETLLMTTGDVGDGGVSSQNPNSDNGKVLRLNLDGSIPVDNPTPGSAVYSMGHRNSQGLCLGPNGLIYSSEHGQNSWDEFNLILPGRNYGWPNVEGACDNSGGQGNEVAFCEANDVVEPLKTWSPCPAVNGIEWYDHPAIPEWQGSVLMAVLGGLGAQYERLSVLHMSEDGLTVVDEDQHFASFNQRIRDVAVNPYTGAVYLAFNGTQYPGSGPNIIKEFRPASTSGQAEWDTQRGVDVFPNPASETIQFNVSDEWNMAQVQAWSLTGQLVWEGRLTQGATLDVVNWEAGSYLLTMNKPSLGRGNALSLTRLVVVE